MLATRTYDTDAWNTAFGFDLICIAVNLKNAIDQKSIHFNIGVIFPRSSSFLIWCQFMDTFSIFLNITQASHWLYFDPYSYRTRINQPDFVLDIYSIIIYVYTDTSTSFIFRLQPLMLSNESHSRFIFSKINNCFFRITVDILSYRISTILKLNRVRKN